MGESSVKQFPCQQCGATLEWNPGAEALVCPYCEFSNPLPKDETPVEELDFWKHLESAEAEAETDTAVVVQCEACGAQTTLEENVVGGECAFCGGAVVAEQKESKGIKPRSLLPFRIDRRKAQEAFQDWLKGLWFAPNGLARYARVEKSLAGLYTPYWTYDSRTISQYSGQRGDDYWDTETYTTTENGKTVRKTRQVRKTRWTYVSGTVRVPFDDVLVCASETLPDWMLRRIEPWDLPELVPHNEDYLAGFRTERYQVDLKQGFLRARQLMDEEIRDAIRDDIGGDRQRIHDVNTRYDNVTFKHILLPIWISAFRYRQQPYRFVVNGRTGAVAGERPWSFWKIFFLVVVIILLVGGVLAALHAGGALR